MVSKGRGRFSLGTVLAAIARPLAWIVIPLLIWEVAARASHLPSYILPRPSDVLHRMVVDAPMLATQAARSLILIIEGFLVGAIPAVIVSLLIVSFPLLERAIYPLIVFIQATPQVAIAPLLIVWFGYGALPKIILTAMLTFFPVLVDSATGFKSIDPRLYFVTRSMGASRWKTFTTVQVPSALPFMMSGFKISLLTAVTVIIVIEFLSSNEGLGYVAVRGLSNQDTPLMFAAIFVAILIGLLLNYLVEFGERLIMPWRHGHQQEA
jgi:NitT/TauT family transport system permease protein